jgi:hypothetical protein
MASGATTTVRQVGSALGIAVIGTVVTTETVRHAIGRITASATLAPAVKARAAAQVHALGANYQPLADVSRRVDSELSGIVAHAVSSASRSALLFAAMVVLLGTCASFLIPAQLGATHAEPTETAEPAETVETAEGLAPFLPAEPEAELLAPPPPLGGARIGASSNPLEETRDPNYL